MLNSNAKSSAENARCPAAGSLVKALKAALSIISKEFRIPDDLIPIIIGNRCGTIRESWDLACSAIIGRYRAKGRRVHQLKLTLKSCKRLFDSPCFPCDSKASSLAKSRWDEHVGHDVPVSSVAKCKKALPALEARVRILAGGWGRKLREKRDFPEEPYLGEYVPDLQGCLEVRSACGGTLACDPSEESQDSSLVRRGVAKTKGKHRVVTMQSARVKRILRPVHNALYGHLSDFGWCVRGDVTKRDMRAVAGDRRPGERFISGDYESATDNIYLPAVDAIVRVLSEDPYLTSEERRVLVESFSDLRWLACTGAQHPINRGSMMGNLVSFPILCLLNKACYDIACDICFEGKDCSRVGRFNGDDCAFCGDSDFFLVWKSVVSHYGLVVNESKTGRSSRWIEFNSSIFDVRRDKFIPKPVLSFLRPGRYEPGSILSSVINGISSFSWSIQQWIVKVVMRYEICLRGVTAELSCLGPRWRKELVRCRWFRSAALDGPAPVIRRGESREDPVVKGPPPSTRLYGFVSRAAASLKRERLEKWLGVKVTPINERIDRKNRLPRNKSPRLHSRFIWRGWKWSFAWPKELWEFVSNFPGFQFSSETDLWKDDHPFLCRKPWIDEISWPHHTNSLFRSSFCIDFPLGYR